MKTLALFLLFLAGSALADTPAPRIGKVELTANGAEITSTAIGAKNALDCAVLNSASNPLAIQSIVSGNPVDPRQIRPLTVADQVSCSQNGSWSISSITGTISLPTGAATAARQDIGNNYLQSLDNKIPAKGPATSANSLPVTFATDASIPVSMPAGMATAANQVTGNATLSSLDTKVRVFDLDSTAGVQNVPGVNLRLSAPSGSVEAGTSANPLRVDVTGATVQPVTATVLPLPTGAATSAAQATSNSFLQNLDTKTPALGQNVSAASIPVVISSNQSAVPVSQSGTWTVNSNLPTGASTSALQTSGNATLSSLDTKTPTVGQKLSAASSPVVISSDQSPIPITGSITANDPSVGVVGVAVPASATQNAGRDGSGNLRAIAVTTTGTQLVDGSAVTQPVSATALPLPTGAATSAAQSSGNVSLSSIDSKLSSTGSALRVDGSATTQPVSATALPLPTGASTSALQSTGNANLLSIDAKIKNFDLDPGPGLDSVPGVVLRSSAAGGSLELGTAANPIRVDTTGFTPQPVTFTSQPLPTGASTETTLSSLNSKFTNTSNGLKVDNSAVTQPVSAVSLPLPTGASTAALQTTGNSTLTSIDSKIISNFNGILVDGSSVTQPVSAASLPLPTGAATAAHQLVQSGHLQNINDKLVSTVNGIKVDNSAVTQPVSAASLPLPSGASTSALQTSGNASLSSLDSKVPVQGQAASAASVPVVIANDQSALPSAQSGVWNTRLQDGAGTAITSTASGPIQALDVNLVGGSLSLPAGSATEAKQDVGNASLSSIDGKVPTQGQKASTGSVPVVIANDQSPVPASQSGTWNINNVSGTVSLPTGASTSALQTTGNSSLSSIDTKLTSGAQLSQVSNGTNSAAVQATPPAGTEFGLVTRNIPSGTQAVSGTVAVSSLPSIPAGANAIGSVSVSNFPATQPVSGTVAVSNFPTTQAVSGTVTANIGTTNGLALDTSVQATQGTVTAGTAATRSTLTGGQFNTSLPTLTNGQQVATQVDSSGRLLISSIPAGANTIGAVSQSGTWNVNNVTGTVSLPTGAATSALQTTGNSSLSSLDGKFSSLGQKASAASTPVVLSSDQSAIPASQSGSWTVTANQGGTWNINNVSGTVSLPSGASTSALQTSGNASLTSIDGKLNSLGQKAAVGSVPVVIANDQSAVPASQSGTWNINNVSGTVSLPTGASTSALQTSGNSSLSSLDTKTPAQGQATMAASSPVVIASNQTAIPASQSGTWNINNVSGTVSLPTGASTAALQTTGNASLSSVDTKTPALGAAAPAGSTPVVQALDTTSATQNITVQDTASTTSTQAYNQSTVTGTPTANSAAVFSTNSSQNAMVVITGTWTGTLQVETSQNGGTIWIPSTLQILGGSIYQSAFTANVNGSINLTGRTQIRVRAVAAMTGTATVQVNLSANTGPVYIANSIRIADGSNTTVPTPLTILPASTAAAPTNTSTVVALSPNSPLPAGTNSIGTVATITGTATASNQARGKLTCSALTTTYSTALTPGFNVGILHIFNSCNGTIIISINGGATDYLELEPGENTVIDFRANNMFISSGVNIQVKSFTTSTSGTIRISAGG